MGSAQASPAGPGRSSPTVKHFLMHLRSKSSHLVKLQALIIQVVFLVTDLHKWAIDYIQNIIPDGRRTMRLVSTTTITCSVQSGCCPPRQQSSRTNGQWSQHNTVIRPNTAYNSYIEEQILLRIDIAYIGVNCISQILCNNLFRKFPTKLFVTCRPVSKGWVFMSLPLSLPCPPFP